jgi:hypothetical protein
MNFEDIHAELLEKNRDRAQEMLLITAMLVVPNAREDYPSEVD